VRLGVRVASAAVLAGILAAALWLGGPPIDVVVGLATVLGLHEYSGLVSRAGAGRPPAWILYPLGGWLLYRFLLPAGLPALEWGLGAAVVAGLLGGLLLDGRVVVRWAMAVGGALWLGLSLGYYLAVLGWSHSPGDHLGLRIVATTLAAAMAGDIAALFVGTALGRHPLAPRISPGKTVEGAVASAVATVGVVTAGAVEVVGLPVHHGLALGALLSLAAQGGDLVESSLKRSAGAKDSGRLVPGHGGILDRMDSLVLMGPVVYCYLRVFALA
jgi:phosphatidate cytidylyltransferase